MDTAEDTQDQPESERPAYAEPQQIQDYPMPPGPVPGPVVMAFRFVQICNEYTAKRIVATPTEIKVVKQHLQHTTEACLNSALHCLGRYFSGRQDWRVGESQD